MKARGTIWCLAAALAAAAPACAQRGSGHVAAGGGFHGGGMPAAHAAPTGGMHSAPMAPGRHGYPPGGPAAHFSQGPGRIPLHRGYGGGMPLGPGSSVLRRSSSSGRMMTSHYGSTASGNAATHGYTHTAVNHSDHGNHNHGYHHTHYVYVYGGGYGWGGYGYAPWLFYPWLDADLSYNLWHDSGDGSAAPAGNDSTYAEPDNSGPDGYAGAAIESDPNAPTHAEAASMDSDRAPATLLFRDGRAPLRTNNYVVSPEGVVVSDSGNLRTIPLSDIDIARTNQINADAGNGLVLPQ